MENNKLSYISWTVLIAVILIAIGWLLTNKSKANLKTYTSEVAKIEFKYSSDWTNMFTDTDLDKLVQLKSPKVYITVNTLNKSPMGVKSGVSAFNRLSYDNYEEMEGEDQELDINGVEAMKLSYTYTDNEMEMQACEIIIPIDEVKLTILAFHAPQEEFENYQNEIKNIVKSISIK